MAKSSDSVRKQKSELVPPPPGLPEVINLTLGGRSYEVPRIIPDGKVVNGRLILASAKEVKAILGKEDGEHFLAHQDEVPVELREKVVFVFVDWRRPGESEYVAIVGWGGGRCVQCWGWLGGDWDALHRPVRRSA